MSAMVTMARALRGAALLAALGVSGAVLSQMQPPAMLPEVLRDIKRSDNVCRREDGNKPGALWAVKSAVMPDVSCALPPAEVAAAIGRTETVLIDVRTPPEFESHHVDGAPNATVTQVRSKSFLQSKSVVLIGGGKAERELYAACAELKASGFKRVHVLKGGMPMWLARNLPVAGSGRIDRATPRLSTSELWMEGQFDANVVLVARSQAAIQERLPYSHVMAEFNPAAVKAAMTRRQKEMKNAPTAAVILVDAPDVSEEALVQIGKAIEPIALLAYTGGVNAFVREMRQQDALWAAHVRGPKQPACGQ